MQYDSIYSRKAGQERKARSFAQPILYSYTCVPKQEHELR